MQAPADEPKKEIEEEKKQSEIEQINEQTRDQTN